MICEVFFQQPGDLSRFDMTAGLEFRVQQFAIHFELKSSAFGGNEGKSFNICFKFIQKFFRQPDGACGVMSSGTISQFDADHRGLLFGEYITPLLHLFGLGGEWFLSQKALALEFTWAVINLSRSGNLRQTVTGL